MSNRPDNTISQRFVIQEHQTPEGTHWDLMLQKEDILWTWRMDCPPADLGTAPLKLRKIADHPLRFLTYEGPVQNATGSVSIADSGDYDMTAKTEINLTLILRGQRLKGRFLFSQTEPSLWSLKQVTP
jgi:bifunctional non-homologous end joining protein LigD